MPELGAMGVQSIWKELSDYLEEHSLQEVDVMGKSLGGAHAQYLTVLITGKTRTRVASLVTSCSVGVTVALNHLFSQALAESQKETPLIWMVRNGGRDERGEVDYVPFIGGPHLHTAPDRTRVYYLIPGHSAEGIRDCLPTHHSLLRKVIKFVLSFPLAHLRQTTLRDFVVREETAIEDEANKGSQLERLRSLVAHVFKWFLKSFVPQGSFHHFYTSL